MIRGRPHQRGTSGLIALAVTGLTLAACGGGGGNAGQSDTILGVVIDGAISGATVCLDLNRNVICDGDEPRSAPTDTQGQFAIDGLSAEVVADAAPLVAEIPADAVDADNPGQPIGIPYRMTSTGGQQQAVISPLTTLLQTGVSQGLSLAEARTAVAAQADVPVAALESNYTLTPTDPDSQRLADFASQSVVPQLQSGQALRVDPPTQSLGSGYTVTRFRFDDNANYTIGTLTTDGFFSGGLSQYQPVFYDVRNGVAQSTQAFFSGDIYLADDDTWQVCDASKQGTLSGGNPRRVEICGSRFVQTSQIVNLSGQNMEDVVIDLIATNGSAAWDFNTAPIANAVFPPGATRIVRQSRRLVDNGRYNPLDGAVPGVTTLDEMILAYPTPVTTPQAGNTLSLGSVFDSNGTRIARLRVAFGPDGNRTRYYACNDALTNCTDDGEGTYLSGVLGGAPALVFTGVADDIEADRLFVQREGEVWFGEIARPQVLRDLSRLNDTAFRALANELGAILPVALR
jgi:hypothetical protein